MEKYDRGSLFSIETEVIKSEPFATGIASDVNSIKLTIKAPDSTAKVDNVDMTNHSIGKYYYKVQTTIDWKKGLYYSTITISNGIDNDITVEDTFYLE